MELVDYSAIIDAGITAYQNLVAEGKINKDGTPVFKTSEKAPSEPKKPVNEGEKSPAVDEALEDLQ